MRLRPFMFLLALEAVPGCTNNAGPSVAPTPVRFMAEEHHFDCDLPSMARSSAEAQAIDCGEARDAAARRKTLACIREAAGKPFVAVIHHQGVDSEVIEALLGTASGEVSQLWYDSDPSGGDNPRNAVITRRRCERLEASPEEPSSLKCIRDARMATVCRATSYTLGPVQPAALLCLPNRNRPAYFFCKKAPEGVTEDDSFRPVPPGTLLACKPTGRKLELFECSASAEADEDLGFPLDGWRNP